MDMGRLLISVSKADEALIRKLAKEDFGGKKGAISAVVQAALPALEKELAHQKAVDRVLADMREGFIDLKGAKPYEKRADIYAERLRKQGLD